MTVRTVPQEQLSDFGVSSPRSRCPVCNDTTLPASGYRDRYLLEHLYVDDDLTRSALADLFECSESTIQNWLTEFDIKKGRYSYTIPEDELRTLYLEKERSIEDIADHYGCSYIAVRNRLKNYDIDIRSSGALLRDADSTRYQDKEWLSEQYLEREKSKQVIADECGVSESTIQYWVDKYDIQTRNLAEAQHQRHVRKDEPYMDADVLYELYWGEMLTQREIADKFGVSQLAVQRWMNRFDIELRYAGAHGNTYKTERGEYVRSSHEREIANWLHERGVDYVYEPDVDVVSLQPDFPSMAISLSIGGCSTGRAMSNGCTRN